MTTILGPAAAWKAQEWAVKAAREFCGDGTMTMDASSLVPMLRLAWREGHFQRVMDEAERLTVDLGSAAALVRVTGEQKPAFERVAEGMRSAEPQPLAGSTLPNEAYGAPLDSPPAA